MKNHDIEKKISSAYDKITPDLLDAVLSDCREQKGKTLIMTNQRSFTAGLARRLTAAAASLAIIAGGAFAFLAYRNNFTTASTISLDVNPSVEISINKNEKVLDVTALNSDGKTIIGDMEFKNSSLDVTVNALIGSMLRNGYLTDLTNSILISVEGTDPVMNAAVRQKVSEDVNNYLASETFAGAVLSQTVSPDDALLAAAEEKGISAGKAQLVQQIVNQNGFYSFSDLAELSINELNLLSMSSSLNLTEVETTGTASDKAYIGEKSAKEIALTHAGVSESDIFKYEIEIDYDFGVIVYDVEFETTGLEYDYEINAVTGEILKSHKENENNYKKAEAAANQPAPSVTEPSTQPTAEAPSIDAEQAKAAAFTHAGVTEDKVFDLEVDLDREHNALVYEIDFQVGANEYEYDISAADGTVIKHKTKIDKDYIDPASVSDLIDKESAKNAAFNHAGVAAADVHELEIDLDKEKGLPVYEIEFKSGAYEYEFEINASTGEVVKYDKELDD